MSDLELKEKDTESFDDGDDFTAKPSRESDPVKPKKRGLRERLKQLKERIKNFFANPKKRLIFIIVMGVILIGLVAVGFYAMTHDKQVAQKAESKKEDKNEEIKYEAPLDGVMTDQESASRHPLGIIVENHPDARPQAGLDKASVIYEAIAEGGITRFLALYGTYEAEKVGPVRSARTYFVDWAHGYDAYLAHVGGNMDALDKIRSDRTLDLDQFSFPVPYWRDNGLRVSSEHTMFTSTAKLREQAAKNKYPTTNNFNIYKFKDDPSTDTDKAALPEKQMVSVNFSSAQYKVDFEYDKSTNSYKRLLAGTPHTDRVSKNQLNPKNIIVMTVDRKPTVTRINEQGYIMSTQGSGKATIFIDGKQIKGKWSKESATDRELFLDEAGNEITFNRGQFWICVIPPEGTISVQ